MRMWMVDPQIMCRQHLLGEHVEIHMFVGAISHERSVKGHLDKGQFEFHTLYARHDELVEEMKRRGYKHCSELDEKWKIAEELGRVDRKKSLEELLKRCPRCKNRHDETASC